jgi:cell division protein FtsB
VVDRGEYSTLMYNVSKMFEKIQKLSHHPYIEQFRDVRVVGFLVFGVLVLLVSYSGVNVIQANYVLQKQVAQLEQENQVSELENNNQKLQNQYYNTDQYLELVARKQFGKGLPGETLLLVPKSVALAHTIPPTANNSEPTKHSSAKPRYQQNLEAWRDLFLKGAAQLKS